MARYRNHPPTLDSGSGVWVLPFGKGMSISATDVGSVSPSLSGELGDLLIEFAAGVQRASVYGPDHGAVLDSARAFVARNASRRLEFGVLSIASAGGRLIVETRPSAQLVRRLGGVATGLEHPLLGALAERLELHDVFAIDIAEDVTDGEIAEILGILSTDPAVSGRPLGQLDEDLRERLPHIRVHRGDGMPDRAALPDLEQDDQLWGSFARTVLAIPDVYEERDYSPREVASAMCARANNPDFWPAVLDRLEPIALHLGQTGPLDSIDLARALSDVLRRLDPDTRRLLLSMGDDRELRNRVITELANALDPDVVFELIQSAAAEESAGISNWMLRLLSKIARYAQADDGAVRGMSDVSLREQVRRLVSDWNLDNTNPKDYEQTLLQSVAAPVPDRGRSGAARGSITGIAPTRLVTMGLEIDSDSPTVWHAVDRGILHGNVSDLATVLQRCSHSPLAERIWQRLTQRPVLLKLVQEESPDWELLDWIIPRSGPDGADIVLDRLMASDSLAIRRRLFDYLVNLGPVAGERAVRCLAGREDTPWYVARNVLALISMLESRPAKFDPSEYLGHERPQVRLEAIRACLGDPTTRDEALVRALADDDSRIVALGVVDAVASSPPEAERRLEEIAVGGDKSEFAEFRTHAIRALAARGSDRAREVLLEIAAPRRRGVRRLLPAPSPEFLAAVRGLRQAWPEDERTGDVLRLARESDDARIREAAS
jgi:hypothetical protein